MTKGSSPKYFASVSYFSHYTAFVGGRFAAVKAASALPSPVADQLPAGCFVVVKAVFSPPLLLQAHNHPGHFAAVKAASTPPSPATSQPPAGCLVAVRPVFSLPRLLQTHTSQNASAVQVVCMHPSLSLGGWTSKSDDGECT